MNNVLKAIHIFFVGLEWIVVAMYVVFVTPEYILRNARNALCQMIDVFMFGSVR